MPLRFARPSPTIFAASSASAGAIGLDAAWSYRRRRPDIRFVGRSGWGPRCDWSTAGDVWRKNVRIAIVVLGLAAVSPDARAIRPFITDDAGVVGKGHVKLESFPP